MGSTARQGTGGPGRGCRLLMHNPSILFILLLSISLILVVSADGQFCKACDVSYLTVGIVPSMNLSNKVNVSAQLHYITVPDTSNPQAFIDDIQAGKLKINEIEDYVPSGVIFNETVEIYFRQNISGTVFESQHCNKSTNATGSVNCEVEVGTQGCGNIYAYYNGSEKYSSSLGSVPYCVRGAVPFTTLLGPECFTLAIFFGLLIAGMYATGKQPLKAFEIAKPRVKSSPPMYPPHKWKRYTKLQVNKVAGSAYMKARTGMRIMSLNMLAGSLEKKGMLPAGMAARVKGLSIEDKVLKMLPNVREGIDKTNLVKMSAEKDLNEAAARLKQAIRKEDMVKLKAELKQKQAAYALAAASLRDQQDAYNKLIGHQLKDLDSFVKRYEDAYEKYLAGNGPLPSPPSNIIDTFNGAYYASMRNAQEGAKQDPMETALKALNPNYMRMLGDKDMLFMSVARAQIFAEEANNSAIFLVSKEIDKLPEGSKERKDFEKYYTADGMIETRRNFLEEKIMGANKDAYNRYTDLLKYSRNPNEANIAKILRHERRKLKNFNREYKRLIQTPRDKIEEHAKKEKEIYGTLIARERQLAETGPNREKHLEKMEMHERNRNTMLSHFKEEMIKADEVLFDKRSEDATKGRMESINTAYRQLAGAMKQRLAANGPDEIAEREERVKKYTDDYEKMKSRVLGNMITDLGERKIPMKAKEECVNRVYDAITKNEKMLESEAIDAEMKIRREKNIEGYEDDKKGVIKYLKGKLESDKKELTARIGAEGEMIEKVQKGFKFDTPGQKLDVLNYIYSGLEYRDRKKIVEEWNTIRSEANAALVNALGRIDQDAANDLSEVLKKSKIIKNITAAVDAEIYDSMSEAKTKRKIELEGLLEKMTKEKKKDKKLELEERIKLLSEEGKAGLPGKAVKLDKVLGISPEKLSSTIIKRTRAEEIQDIQNNVRDEYLLSSEVSDSARRIINKYSISYSLSGEVQAKDLVDDARACARRILESKKFKEMKMREEE